MPSGSVVACAIAGAAVFLLIRLAKVVETPSGITAVAATIDSVTSLKVYVGIDTGSGGRELFPDSPPAGQIVAMGINRAVEELGNVDEGA